jgi:hypothetical protein
MRDFGVLEARKPAHSGHPDRDEQIDSGYCGTQEAKGSRNRITMFDAAFHDLTREALGDLNRLGHAPALSDKAGDVRTGGDVATFFEGFHVQLNRDFAHVFHAP